MVKPLQDLTEKLQGCDERLDGLRPAMNTEEFSLAKDLLTRYRLLLLDSVDMHGEQKASLYQRLDREFAVIRKDLDRAAGVG